MMTSIAAQSYRAMYLASFGSGGWRARWDQTMSPSVDLSSSSGPTRVEPDRPNSAFLADVLNESPSNGTATQAVPQGSSEATEWTEPIPTEDQEPNVDLPQPSMESALGLSKKRKRLTPKDPAKFKHECETCGERFTRSTTLREHKRIHNGERPFPCSICSKLFARLKDKNRHEALHAGEKRFHCDLSSWDIYKTCDRHFTREDGLMAHLRTKRGWKCLRALMDDPNVTHGTKFGTKVDNKFCCKLTRLACLAKFHSFTELKEHWEDPTNRRCATEYMVQIFVSILREVHKERADAGGQSSTPSAADKQYPSSSGQRGPQPQQATSPQTPPRPSLEDIRPQQNSTQEPVADAETLAEAVSPDEELTEADRLKHKEAMVAISETRSALSLDLPPVREAHSGFDAFFGWVLIDAGVEQSDFSETKVWVQIKSPRQLTAEYQMRVGTYTRTAEVYQIWGHLPSKGYSYRLQLTAPERIFKNNSLVSLIYGLGLSSTSTFRVGTLHYEFEKHRWQFAKDSSLPVAANVGHMSESPEEVPTAIEYAPTGAAAEEHIVESGQEVVESRNGLSRSFNRQSEPETNLPSDCFAGWEVCNDSCIWGSHYFCVDIRCPKPVTGSWYFDFGDHISAAKYTLIYNSTSSSPYWYRWRCFDAPWPHDQSRIIPVHLLSYAPLLGAPDPKPSVSRFPLGNAKYENGWTFDLRSADS